MPCSNCEGRGISGVVNPAKSSRYGACVKSGYSCNGQGLSVAAGMCFSLFFFKEINVLADDDVNSKDR
jgi:hypothetical protein